MWGIPMGGTRMVESFLSYRAANVGRAGLFGLTQANEWDEDESEAAWDKRHNIQAQGREPA